jgi:hypothetical protein
LIYDNVSWKLSLAASGEVTFHLILERDKSEGESLLVLLGAREAHAGLEFDADAKQLPSKTAFEFEFSHDR